jgi:hypothetical protein
MSLSWRILVAGAAMSLFGIAGSVAVANATTPPKIDCYFQVNAAGNGHSTYLATGSPAGSTLSPNGTVATGQVFDLLDSAAPMIGSDGDTLLPAFPRNQTWYPVTNSAGTALMTVIGPCSLDSGNQ